MSASEALQSLGDGRFRLTGAINYGNAARWLEQGLQAFAGQQQVELDLAQLEAGDSAGLAVLVEWCLAAQRDGRVLNCGKLPRGLEVIAGLGGVAGLLQGEPA